MAERQANLIKLSPTHQDHKFWLEVQLANPQHLLRISAGFIQSKLVEFLFHTNPDRFVVVNGNQFELFKLFCSVTFPRFQPEVFQVVEGVYFSDEGKEWRQIEN